MDPCLEGGLLMAPRPGILFLEESVYRIMSVGLTRHIDSGLYTPIALIINDWEAELSTWVKHSLPPPTDIASDGGY